MAKFKKGNYVVKQYHDGRSIGIVAQDNYIMMPFGFLVVSVNIINGKDVGKTMLIKPEELSFLPPEEELIYRTENESKI